MQNESRNYNDKDITGFSEKNQSMAVARGLSILWKGISSGNLHCMQAETGTLKSPGTAVYAVRKADPICRTRVLS